MNVLLVVAHLVVVGSLVEEPVEKVAADLLKSLGSDCVGWTIVTVGLGLLGGDAVVGIWIGIGKD